MDQETGEDVSFFFFIGRILLQEFDESFPESFIESIPAGNHEGVGNSPHHGFNNPPFHACLDWISLFQPEENTLQSEVRTRQTPPALVLDRVGSVGLRDGLDELPIRAEVDDDDAEREYKTKAPNFFPLKGTAERSRTGAEGMENAQRTGARGASNSLFSPWLAGWLSQGISDSKIAQNPRQ